MAERINGGEDPTDNVGGSIPPTTRQIIAAYQYMIGMGTHLLTDKVSGVRTGISNPRQDT